MPVRNPSRKSELHPARTAELDTCTTPFHIRSFWKHQWDLEISCCNTGLYFNDSSKRYAGKSALLAPTILHACQRSLHRENCVGELQVRKLEMHLTALTGITQLSTESPSIQDIHTPPGAQIQLPVLNNTTQIYLET